MPVLRVSNAAFDVDAFLADCPWTPSAVFRRGDVGIRGRVAKASGFNLSIGRAGFDDFAGQQAEAIAFLTREAAEVRRLVETVGEDEVVLDFGIERREVAGQFDRFSAGLVRVAGVCGLALELSHYAVSPPTAG